MDSKRNKTLTKNEVKTKYRRSNGEGTIYLRKDGRWSGAITVGLDENGKIIKRLFMEEIKLKLQKS